MLRKICIPEAHILTPPKGLTYEASVPCAIRLSVPRIRRPLQAVQRLSLLCTLGVLCLCAGLGRAAEGGSLAAPTENLYGVDMLPDGKRILTVGPFGSVFRSDDGGHSWQAQRTPVTDPLFDVSIVSAAHAVIVGQSGIVLVTRDGGATWDRAKTSASKHLFSVAMIDARRGWAVGDWGVILRTDDGGATWTDRSLKDDVVLSAVEFVDERHGWIVGEFGTILATTDGGETWQRQSSGADKTIFGVAFASPHLGWAVGIDGLVLRTRDGGASWEVQRGSVAQADLEQLAFIDLLTNPGLYDVAVAGSLGVIVGDTGSVLVTKDGGDTWQPRQLPEDVRLLWLRGATLTTSGAGIMVGANGLVVPIADGELREPGIGKRYAAHEPG